MKRVRLSDISPFSGRDKCETFELVGKDAAIERREYSVAKTIVPPRTEATQHFHEHTEELYVVTGGVGTIVVDGKSIDVSAGDTVLIEVGERHFAMSNSDSGLEFLAISFPAYDSADFLVED
ncbi:MAG: cupin domain-containing protein [Pseudomonadota bacterium]